MLIDHAKIYVCGGRGGNGCQSLYKDIFHPRGIPDGGDGGTGGNVILTSDSNLHTLLDFKYNQHYRAANGAHGSSNKKFGRKGSDCVVKVPVGTLVNDAKEGFLLKDMVAPGDELIVARGGAGGKGSAKLAMAQPGQPGEFRELVLELKLVADVGIIGLPNAGKSTLISNISKAHSKIADYPFTTKSPKLGVVRSGDENFVVADMPGLIEGAHEGRGLGDKFLRHIERTVCLVHLVDMAPLDGSDPAENYFKLEKELELYDKKVYDKKRIIAANKMDLAGAEKNLKNFIFRIKGPVYPISALKKKKLGALVEAMHREIERDK